MKKFSSRIKKASRLKCLFAFDNRQICDDSEKSLQIQTCFQIIRYCVNISSRTLTTDGARSFQFHLFISKLSQYDTSIDSFQFNASSASFCFYVYPCYCFHFYHLCQDPFLEVTVLLQNYKTTSKQTFYQLVAQQISSNSSKCQKLCTNHQKKA